MTRDDILRMAREAGLAERHSHIGQDGFAFANPDRLERFAAIVAAHERNQCVHVAKLVAREIDDTNGTATYIAKAIQARGEK